jgi:hypothetical protein
LLTAGCACMALPFTCSSCRLVGCNLPSVTQPVGAAWLRGAGEGMKQLNDGVVE